jgi:hypothetical protein
MVRLYSLFRFLPAGNCSCQQRSLCPPEDMFPGVHLSAAAALLVHGSLIDEL